MGVLTYFNHYAKIGDFSRLFSLSHHVKELSKTKLNGGIDVHEICNSDPKLVFVLHDIGDSHLNFWRLRIRWQRG